MHPRTAANEVYRLPPKLFDARCRACWTVAGGLALVALSFWSLDLQWAQFFSQAALARMGRFAGELLAVQTSPAFLARLAPAALETLAMSVVGTLLAVTGGLLLAWPASRRPHGGAPARYAARLVLNVLRSIPELLWAALLLVAAGLGPLAGTLALALHTTGVLGRLFAAAIAQEKPVPVYFIGVGEKLEDLQTFNAREFALALLGS